MYLLQNFWLIKCCRDSLFAKNNYNLFIVGSKASIKTNKYQLTTTTTKRN